MLRAYSEARFQEPTMKKTELDAWCLGHVTPVLNVVSYLLQGLDKLGELVFRVLQSLRRATSLFPVVFFDHSVKAEDKTVSDTVVDIYPAGSGSVTPDDHKKAKTKLLSLIDIALAETKNADVKSCFSTMKRVVDKSPSAVAAVMDMSYLVETFVKAAEAVYDGRLVLCSIRADLSAADLDWPAILTPAAKHGTPIIQKLEFLVKESKLKQSQCDMLTKHLVFCRLFLSWVHGCAWVQPVLAQFRHPTSGIPVQVLLYTDLPGYLSDILDTEALQNLPDCAPENRVGVKSKSPTNEEIALAQQAIVIFNVAKAKVDKKHEALLKQADALATELKSGSSTRTIIRFARKVIEALIAELGKIAGVSLFLKDGKLDTFMNAARTLRAKARLDQQTFLLFQYIAAWGNGCMHLKTPKQAQISGKAKADVEAAAAAVQPKNA
jgi:hypothetical protein